MEDKNKKMIIYISCAILLIIIVVICFIFMRKPQKEEQENTVIEEVEKNEIIEEINNDNEQENEIEEPTVENTIVENAVSEEVQDSEQQAQDQIIGREEQESIEQQNQGPTNEEKVLELVKNKWGANDSTVSFNIANHDGDNYMVSVNNKETTQVMAWYQVNLSTGEVTQQ